MVRQRFQGLCLSAQEGRYHMRNSFDVLPISIRQRLRDSPFNLCAACICEASDPLQQIEEMEQMIREGEDDGQEVS